MWRWYLQSNSQQQYRNATHSHAPNAYICVIVLPLKMHIHLALFSKSTSHTALGRFKEIIHFKKLDCVILNDKHISG